MRHNGPSLWFTRYTRSQRIPITHAPRVDRFYTRPTAVLAAQAPLVTTFATHFLLPNKVGASVQKIGAWERPRARDARPAIPLSPLPPRTAIHILKRRSGRYCTSLPYNVWYYHRFEGAGKKPHTYIGNTDSVCSRDSFPRTTALAIPARLAQRVLSL